MKTFLPKTRMKTIIWFDRTAESIPWEMAQGKATYKKLLAPTIELNLLLTLQRQEHLDLVCEKLVDNWLKIKLLLETRKDLVNKDCQDKISPKGERFLYQANLLAIRYSPELKRFYTDIALECILGGEWKIESGRSKTYAEIVRLLTDWKAARTDITLLVDKSYLRAIGETHEGEENAIYVEEEEDDEEETLPKRQPLQEERDNETSSGSQGGEVPLPKGETDPPLDNLTNEFEDSTSFSGLESAFKSGEEQ